MSKICKYAGDKDDKYCASCDGITMEVDSKKIPCTECAGYEAGTEDAEPNDEFMNVPEDDLPINDDVAEETNNKEKSVEKTTKTKKTNNNTSNKENVKSESKNKATTNKKADKPVKVKEEKQAVETTSNENDAIKVISIRYTSGATIKKGDNYFKFIAEEEWDVSQIEESSMDDTREMLWAKLNSEVDKQIEELQNIN